MERRQMKKALLVGESWTTHMIHQKGFDSFTTTEYVEGADAFVSALSSRGWDVDHIPSHAVEARFPGAAALGVYDVVVLSDIGANSFLLPRSVFSRSEVSVDRLAMLREYVRGGGGLVMVGGYLSFSGIDARAAYADSPLAGVLPVEALRTDDRAERPEGVRPVILEPEHPALGGIGSQWPALLGFNRTLPSPDARVLAEIDGAPLVAVGGFGAGKTVAFTSDMSPHWAPAEFLAWPGYGRLWDALCSWAAGAPAADEDERLAALQRLVDDDPFHAFMDYGRIVVPGRSWGPLAGLTFTAKDHYAVAGVPSGNGNPRWLATHDTPSHTSPIVQKLLDAGATLVGKTHQDDLGWSINGVNGHYPTPTNPAAPDRIPGGSSSGSAAAVAGGIVPFALASDGGGSIRTPASYCGLLGIRPTWGRLLDPSMGGTYGTSGWLARDAELFARIGDILLVGEADLRPVPRLLLAEDLFATLEADVREALAPAVALVESAVAAAEPLALAAEGVDHWRETFKITQAEENLAGFGEWIRVSGAVLSPDIQGRYESFQGLTLGETLTARVERAAIRERLHALLGDGSVLIVPSAPGAAPRRESTWEQLDEWRERALGLLCPAGMGGLVQVSLPLAEVDGAPLGLSLVAAPGRDEVLLELSKTVMSLYRPFPAAV
jgi:amidase